MSYVMEINLTAPEVHPPQRIELYDNDDAYLYGIVPDGLNVILGTWHSDGRSLFGHDGTHLFSPEHDSSQWRWYLGWAFADIAREAERVGCHVIGTHTQCIYGGPNQWFNSYSTCRDGV